MREEAAVNSWINLTALWQIVVVGLLAGAGLPALFAIGLRALSLPGGAPAKAAAGEADSDAVVGGSIPGIVAGAVCFTIVLAAIGWGIYAIYQAGH
ncbi:MAG TPA: hypothetical protein VGI58_12225 [Streptosporangiaceae bacterium]|jgi:hypothetical protein